MLAGLVAFAAVTWQAAWIFVRHINVMAHEGAHALTASALGAKIRGIRLNRDATGLTVSVGRHHIAVTIAGYLGPSAFGLVAAKLISVGQAAAVLWLGLTVVAFLLPSLRNLFGVALAVIIGGLLYATARFAPIGLETFIAYALAWFLLLSGVRMVADHGRHAGDAASLKQYTHIPPVLWAGFWLAATIAAAVLGGTMLA